MPCHSAGAVGFNQESPGASSQGPQEDNSNSSTLTERLWHWVVGHHYDAMEDREVERFTGWGERWNGAGLKRRGEGVEEQAEVNSRLTTPVHDDVQA